MFPKPHKFNAKRTLIGDQSFPSKLEADVWAQHVWLKTVNMIDEIERHPTFKLTDAQISYKADFLIKSEKSGDYAIEAKGMETERWRLIKKLWKFYGPMRLEVWKARGGKVYLDETITPKGI